MKFDEIQLQVKIQFQIINQIKLIKFFFQGLKWISKGNCVDNAKNILVQTQKFPSSALCF
jgi:hypothetical protein